MTPTKETILALIRETSVNGIPSGKQKFTKETGIKKYDWYGKYWSSWSEAVAEAGLLPNQITTAIPLDNVLEAVARLARRLGKVPSEGDCKLEKSRNQEFPSHATVQRLGNRAELRELLRKYADENEDFQSLHTFLPKTCEKTPASFHQSFDDIPEKYGFIYLIKAGKFYKIGKTWDLARRSKEIKIQLAEKSETVHVINTDDIDGIERYWHERFKDKRKNGEWFELAPSDLRAFKKRKFM